MVHHHRYWSHHFLLGVLDSERVRVCPWDLFGWACVLGARMLEQSCPSIHSSVLVVSERTFMLSPVLIATYQLSLVFLTLSHALARSVPSSLVNSIQSVGRSRWIRPAYLNHSFNRSLVDSNEIRDLLSFFVVVAFRLWPTKIDQDGYCNDHMHH